MSHVKINILVVEDNIQDYIIFKEILGQIRDFFIHVEHAQELETAIELVQSQKFDIVFLDLFLPDSFGQETFTSFQAQDEELPVVILSGLSDKNIALEIVKLGAQDYIVKGEFDSNLLEKSIVYSIERKKFQDRLRLSEEKYRTTFQAVGVAIAEYDYTEMKIHLDELRAAGVTDLLAEIKLDMSNMARYRGMMKTNNANPETLRLYECSSAEEFANNSIKFYTRDTIPHLESLIKLIWDGRDYYEGEAGFVTATGRKIVTLKRVVVLGADLGYYRMIISTVDVTRLKQKEMEVVKQAEILQGISDSAVHLLEETDLKKAMDLTLKTCGLAFGADRAILCRYFPRGESYHFNFSNFWDKDGLEYFELLPENLRSGIMHESPFMEFSERFEEGEIIEFYEEDMPADLIETMGKAHAPASLVIPILEDGALVASLILNKVHSKDKWTELQISGALSVARNIGSALATNKARTDLQALNQNLEQVVQDRTAKMEEAIKELESFSYSVSHDLRAPLRAIGGFTQVLEQEYRDHLDDNGKHYLDVIKQGSREMSQLIDDLLDFSRMGRKTLQFSSIDMDQLVREVIRELSEQVPDRKINFHVHQLTPCRGDRAMIKQVVVNFIWNAIKYSKKQESATIEVGCKTEGTQVEYFVKDNGIGFDMRYADKLFGVFQRLHLNEDFDGTGVGLAIVQRIVNRHTGKVRAYGEVDRGATFYFSLPTMNSEEELMTVSETTR